MTHSTRTPSFPANSSDYAPWVAAHGLVAPYGECQCGCGQRVAISREGDKRHGKLSGHPARFLRGHSGRRQVEDRFWPYVIKPEGGGCWVWVGAKNDYGYGVLRGGNGDGLSVRAHRFSYELHLGTIPAGMKVLHRCDTPACVNPDHLFLGTHADNSKDKVSKGRHAVGERFPHAKLTAALVLEIRDLFSQGVPKTELADRYGVGVNAISRVVTRQTWKHVK